MESRKRDGLSKITILDVRFCQIPKCRARHVTSCPGPMRPDVTPAMARSPVAAVERVCMSMLRDRSKTRSMGAATIVTISMVGTAGLLCGGEHHGGACTLADWKGAGRGRAQLGGLQPGDLDSVEDQG